jgi:hypothetical protein
MLPALTLDLVVTEFLWQPSKLYVNLLEQCLTHSKNTEFTALILASWDFLFVCNLSCNNLYLHMSSFLIYLFMFNCSILQRNLDWVTSKAKPETRQVKEANLKGLHTTWVQLYDILIKKDQWFPGLGKDKKVKHRGLLGQ